MTMTGNIHFEGVTRNIDKAYQLDAQRVLMLLSAPGKPVIAVTGNRPYADAGLITDMVGHHKVEDPARFEAKLEMLIDLGVYD
jgi:hypothetical protein